MKEVNQEEFYKIIGPLDVCIRIEDEKHYPYTSLFELRYNRKLIGKIVNSYTDNIDKKYPIITKYYLFETT